MSPIESHMQSGTMTLLSKNRYVGVDIARSFEFHCSFQICRFINFEHLPKKLMQVRTPDQSSYGNITASISMNVCFCTSQTSILKYKHSFFALSSFLHQGVFLDDNLAFLKLSKHLNRIASFSLNRGSSFNMLFGISNCL